MITPIFRLDQDCDNLIIIIRIVDIRTLSNPNEIEIYHEDREFIFYGKPYYLRLKLPGQVESSYSIEEDADQLQAEQMGSIGNNLRCSFDCDRNELKIKIPKKNRGEHFSDLEMIGNFLCKPKKKFHSNLIEVDEITQINDEEENEDEDFDWTLEQTLPQLSLNVLARERYGFANSFENIFDENDNEILELIDVREPGRKSIQQRRLERLRKENGDFDEEHYLADLFDDEMIANIVEKNPSWVDSESNSTIWIDMLLNDEDRQRIIDQLPRKEFPKFNSITRAAIVLSLCDILYAYLYDLRTTDFEHTVESAWTIRKLSPTISWFEFWIPIRFESTDQLMDSIKIKLEHPQKQENNHFDFEKNLIEFAEGDNLPLLMMISCIRRSLIYPLYRNWKLSIRVANDLVDILLRGRNAILKCLLGKFKI
ncbi:Protein SHQ1 -like protein [Sarcoptes scabiei]|uniref:Protein SHQ1 homolog n=1 Tax=Sarcoptes scabiei TaxID=52283 RepID=A0A834RAP8_SARSC|nr:Protein SHQ1 -like protein [Sarcoptes scabiei]